MADEQVLRSAIEQYIKGTVFPAFRKHQKLANVYRVAFYTLTILAALPAILTSGIAAFSDLSESKFWIVVLPWVGGAAGMTIMLLKVKEHWYLNQQIALRYKALYETGLREVLELESLQELRDFYRSYMSIVQEIDAQAAARLTNLFSSNPKDITTILNSPSHKEEQE